MRLSQAMHDAVKALQDIIAMAALSGHDGVGDSAACAATAAAACDADIARGGSAMNSERVQAFLRGMQSLSSSGAARSGGPGGPLASSSSACLAEGVSGQQDFDTWRSFRENIGTTGSA